MPRDFDAIFLITQVPGIEFRDGTFHVIYEIGRHARLEVAMSPHVFLKALRAANKCAEEFHDGSKPVPIRRSK